MTRLEATALTSPTAIRPGAGWRRSTHDRYVPRSVLPSVDQRIVEQAGRLGPGQAVTGWAALRLLGAGLCDGIGEDGSTTLPVPLAVGPRGRLRQTSDTLVCHDRLSSNDVLWCDGIWITSAERATFDAVRLARDLRASVAVLDTALGAGLITLATMERWIVARSGWWGIRRMRAALPLARVGVRSPKETVLRLHLEIDLGIVGLLVNHVVHGDAGRIGEVDLLDECAGMAIEFDGADHRTAAQQTRDLGKQQALDQIGLVTARVTGADLHGRGVVGARITQTRSRALFLAPEQRLWKLEPPVSRQNPVLAHRLRMARHHDPESAGFSPP